MQRVVIAVHDTRERAAAVLAGPQADALALGQGQIAAGASVGIQAMITVAMIALGLGAGAFMDRVLWSSRKTGHPGNSH